MKEFNRLVITLTLIAAGAGMLLSLVESVTREPIAMQRSLQQLKALSAVLPEFDNSPDTDVVLLEVGKDKKGHPVQRTFFRARQGEQLVGIAFKVTAADGYSGNIEVMVGLDTHEHIVGIEILAHAETPGLGSKISESWFKDLFRERSLDNTDWRVKKDGGEIDQITGATISPRAIVSTVKSGLDFFHQHRQQIVAAPGE
ncbi:MAG: RnfABCDGE type electron transport complex subunit G [Desulfuromonas sp.]|nr:RnfABCDGE type electron transport complex subunit G [Desulfuromonas sp.]